MLDHIRYLETIARQLEPSPAQRGEWDRAVWAYANAFLSDLEGGQTYYPSDHHTVDFIPIGEEPQPVQGLMEWFSKQVGYTGINPASGGHLGYVPGGGVYPTALADFLAAVTNRYAGVFFANPGAVRIENQVIRWLCDLVGFPADTALGNLASGGSIANLTAITAARDHLGIKARDVEKAVIYLTAQVHHCVQKAIRIAGLGEAIIRYIPMNEDFRMDVAALEHQVAMDKAAGLRPFLLVASAGTTDTGAIDPLDAIATVAKNQGLWFHIDGAYGGAFLLLEDFKQKFKGIERADSVVVDPHKGFFLAYGLGAVLVRDVQTLYRSQYYQANYMQDTLASHDEWSPADLSPELTKHFRGLRFWLSLQLLGLKPFRAALEEKIWLCRYFFEKIKELEFETGPYPELSIMIFRFVPTAVEANDFNARLVASVQQDGRIFLSSTTIDGVYWIRLAVLSFRTHLNEIDYCLQILKKNAARLLLTE